ncbi:MAG: hypothetical protein JW822_09375 [Spirochaetales bacterium]|nr:hypothetical protein [Spirochaetales bacterium]
MKKQLLLSFVCLLVTAWLGLIFTGCAMPGSHEPGDSETTLTVYNTIADDFSLGAGQWSDDKDARTAEWNSGTVTTMTATTEETIAAGDYEIWIRIGEADYKFIRAGATNVFTLAKKTAYSVTIARDNANELFWTLTDSTVTESGTMQEFPDNPGPVPARVDVSNENSSLIRVHAGVWANDYDFRETLLTSPYITSGHTSDNWEITPGTYNLWIQKNNLLYPLLDGADAAEFFFESDTDYELVIGEDSWVCTNPEDSSQTGGSLSASGFAPEPPEVYESLMNPGDGRVDVWTTYKLNWRASPNTDSCDLYFDTTDGSTLLAGDLLTTHITEYEYETPLAYSTTYYWKVVAKNTSGEYTTEVISFTTEPPLIPELSSIDAGDTNQPEVRIDIAFNVSIDQDTLSTDDFEVTGGATIKRMATINGRYLLVRMPDYHAHVTVTLPADRVEDSQNRRHNIPSNTLEFDYHHFPTGELAEILFQEDARAVWGLDSERDQLVRYDIPRRVILNAWDLPLDNPVAMDRVGNTLYIIYAGDNAVSRFIIDQNTPENSGFSAAAFTIPLRPGNSFEAGFAIAAVPERSGLLICYRDSDWPDDDCICMISAVNGSTMIAPVMAGGNSAGRFMDYEAGRLAVGEKGVSNGEINVYAVGSNSLTQIVPYTDTDTFISFFDMNPAATRIATNCTNTDIIPDDFNKMYYIYDLEISNGELVCRGSWNTGAYCNHPLFSHDSRYLYIMGRSNDTLMVWNADGTGYGKVRDISFPYSSDYCRYALSPDGSFIVGFSYDDYYDENYRFYIFDNIRE